MLWGNPLTVSEVAPCMSDESIHTLHLPYHPRYAIPAGIVAVTITAVDKSGNKDKCEFIVEVTDKEAPWTDSGRTVDGQMECPAGAANGVAVR